MLKITFSISYAMVLLSACDLLSQDIRSDQSRSVPTVVREYSQQHSAEIIDSFRSFVKIPNVSADRDNVRLNAEYVKQEFERRGASMKLLEVVGANPVVYGEINTPGAKRTVLIYAHFDGQPVNAGRWTVSPPFEPTLYSRAVEAGGRPVDWPESGDEINPEWRVYGRSTSDDKAPFVAILAALDALKENQIELTSNIKFFFDGEEEIGSPNMRRVLDQYSDLFKDIDLWVFSDGPLHQSRKPSVYFGVRGVVGLEITVYGATRNLHSGHYGNWAPNPGLMLSKLLSSMKDSHGNVIVDGFYNSTVPLDARELAAVRAVPQIGDSLRRELGLVETENKNESYLLRMQKPSLNIKGIECGRVGAMARNIVPHEATVAMDIRLAKGNHPRKMVELVKQHIRKQGYLVVDSDPILKIRRENKLIAKVVSSSFGYPAARTSMNDPQVVPLVESLEQYVGEGELIQVPSLGGSLPLYLITDYLKQPLIILPMANHDNNQHSPNENLRVGNLFYGIEAISAVLTMEQKK